MKSLPLPQRLPLSRLLVLACIIYGACFDRFEVPDCQYAIIPALIGAGAALLGSAVSGAFKSHAQKTANDANLQSVRETNDLNRELWEKQTQNEWQMWRAQTDNEWNMWNAQNEYNTPLAQAQRYREAGINPQLALSAGQLGSGSASAMSSPSMSAPNAPQMQAGHVQPVDGMADFMGQIPSSFAQIANGLLQTGALDKQKAETEQINAATAGIQIENQYKEQSILSRLAHEAADTSLSEHQRRLAAQQYKWMEETRDLRYTMLENENRSQVANADWLRQQIDSAKIHDSIARLAAWNNTRLTNAQINTLSSEANKLRQEALSISHADARSEDEYNHYTRYANRENLKRLVSTTKDFVAQMHNNKLISDVDYQKALDELDMSSHKLLMSREKAFSGIGNAWRIIFGSDLNLGFGQVMDTLR